MQKRTTWQSYNSRGENEQENIKLLDYPIDITSKEYMNDPSKFRDLIIYVKDRPGHDQRYAINCSKLKEELKQIHSFNLMKACELPSDGIWDIGNGAITYDLQNTGTELEETTSLMKTYN